MGLPDFTPALQFEINEVCEINTTCREMLPDTNGRGKRLDLAGALAHIALDHIDGMLGLFWSKAFASGYALMRPALETSYKSIWVSCVADDKTVEKAYAGRDVYGEFKNIIRDIENEFAGTGWDAIFGKIKPHLRPLHERTHSGAEQVLRRLVAANPSSPDFEFPKILSDIRTLAGTAMLVTIPLNTAENNERLQVMTREKYPWLG